MLDEFFIPDEAINKFGAEINQKAILNNEISRVELKIDF